MLYYHVCYGLSETGGLTIYSVDRACISVLPQGIHSVNEKKNRTDKYDFLCELCEQEHHISSVRFFFIINIYDNALREGTYICPFTSYKSTTKSATLRS